MVSPALVRVLSPLGHVLERVDPFGMTYPPRAPAEAVDAAPPVSSATLARQPAPAALRVMTWNMKYGGARIDFWYEGHGETVAFDRETGVRHMRALADAVRHFDPDLLFVQEVDRPSKRSGFVDQVRLLTTWTHLRHAVYGGEWKIPFIPDRGLGPAYSGNATLARWPLRSGERIQLARAENHDPLTNYFYLRRNILRADLLLPGGGHVVALNAHLEAFGHRQARAAQVAALLAEMRGVVAAGGAFVLGADLNLVPPGTVKVRDFPDAAPSHAGFEHDDFSAELDVLAPIYDAFPAAVPLDVYQRDNAPHFTHTTRSDDFWNRKLDYLFSSTPFDTGATMTHQDAASGGIATMPLSDHAPISARWPLPPTLRGQGR
jgi:endonuclease/exonuclease/phosphatase family metal-dependent hydrolase